MVASATAKTTHGASTIRSVPVIRVASKTASAVTISGPGAHASLVELTW